MNRFIGIGRLTKDPTISMAGETTVARYTLAIDRRYGKTDEQSADFLPCVAFGKNAEFTEKYLKKGVKIAIEGRVQTGSYKNKDGNTVYTTDIIVESSEFVEKKSDNAPVVADQSKKQTTSDNFMDLGDVSDEDLPFN